MSNSINSIELLNVEKSYPGFKALNSISFKVGQGKIHGFLGPNGAGKSTTLNVLTGLLSFESGQVLIEGKNIKSYKSLSQLIGFLPEHPPLYDWMKVKEYLAFVASMNSSSKFEKNSNDEIIQKCGLSDVNDKLINKLSKGYRQRVGIAAALVHRPKIIILDEPMVGLDPHSIIEIRELIKELGKDHTVILSSHQLDEIKKICSEITIINKGVIVESGEVDSIVKKFSSTKCLNITLDSLSAEHEQEFRKAFTIDQFNVDRSPVGKCLLRIEDNKVLEQRKEISKFFIQHDYDLLAMEEEEISLEDVFKKATYV